MTRKKMTQSWKRVIKVTVILLEITERNEKLVGLLIWSCIS